MEQSVNDTGDCYPIFNDDFKCVIIAATRSTVALISMLCSLFVIFLIVLFKKYTFLSQRLILYLSISAFFQALVYGTGNFYVSGRASRGINTGFCIFQGYWTLFFDWLSFIWVLCISFNVFWSAVFRKKTNQFEKFYIMIDLTVPIAICCFPFIGSSYGPAGLWCWISSVREGQVYTTGVVLQFVLFYCPLWFLSVIMLIMLVLIVILLHRRNKKSMMEMDVNADIQKQLWKEEIRPILFFPLVYIAILIFPSINRLRLAGGHNKPDSPENFFFWFMHAITLTLHGTVYALLFACDKQTMSRIRWSHIKAAVSHWHRKPTAEYDLTVNKHRETFYRRDKPVKVTSTDSEQ